MSKVLQRTMFNAPKYEHQSTGIASGLEYRPGYRVGGRVGYATDQSGGIVNDDMLNFNPNLFTGTGVTTEQALDTARQLHKGAYTPDFSQYDTDLSQYAPDLSQYDVDYTDPSMQTDFSKARPHWWSPISGAAGETVGKRFPVGQSQWADFISGFSGKSEDYAQALRDITMAEEKQKVLTAKETAEQARTRGYKEEDIGLQLDLKQADVDLDLALKKDAARNERIAAEQKFKLDRSESITDVATSIYENSNVSTAQSFTEAEGFINLLNNPKTTEKDIFMAMDAFKINGGFTKSQTDLGNKFDTNVWMKNNWKVTYTDAYGKKQELWKSGTSKKVGIPTQGDPDTANVWELYNNKRNNHIANEMNKWFSKYNVASGDIRFTPEMISRQDMRDIIIPQIPESLHEIEGIGQAVDAIVMFGPSKSEETEKFPGGEKDFARKIAIQIIKMTATLQLDLADPEREITDPATQKPRPMLEIDLNKQLAGLKEEYPKLYKQILPYIDNARIRFNKITEEQAEQFTGATGGRVGYAQGGRAGYAHGGQVGISFEEMRTAFTPNQISDYDMKLLANDKTMLGDFASIRDYSELEDFNTKYATNIDLPIG